jgi:hypothetical protein
MAPRVSLQALAPVEASIYQPAAPLDADAAIAATRGWLQHVMAQRAGSTPRV